MSESNKRPSIEVKFQETVEKVQKQVRKGSYTYICRHPEIRAIIRVVLQQAMKNNPEDIFQFTADLFSCSNLPRVQALINEQLKHVNDLIITGNYDNFNEAIFFSRSTQSTHPPTPQTSGLINPLMSFVFMNKKSDECDDI